MYLRIFAAAVLLTVPVCAMAQETGLAGMHDQRRERGKLCMTDHAHWGNGSGATKEAARKEAIRSWMEFTNLEYGQTWASFSKAAGAKTSYVRETTGWSATVEARPCRR